MAQYRTAQGKVLDMGMFTAQHERVRAVGNMKVNARGDTIDSEGRVVQSINDKINEYYGETVSNPGATGTPLPRTVTSRVVESNKTPQPQPKPQPPKVDAAELSDIERELEESMSEDSEEEEVVEQAKTKSKEVKSKK